MTKEEEPYLGYEVGPIRPPSEAYSLLIRLTRNCPWNRCTFCPVYKEQSFSKRSVEHIKKDIDTIHHHVSRFSGANDINLPSPMFVDEIAYQMAHRWYMCGMKAVFLQDADSLRMPASDVVEVLNHLYDRFPTIDRVTSYARSSTIVKIDDADLKRIADAGLTRLHIGLESGSNQILKNIRKGASKEIHIQAGKKVKKTNIELSEYVMPGLGGRVLTREHAVETADALNQINPDFIRLRQLAIPERAPMAGQLNQIKFEQCNDIDVVHELSLFIESLEGIESMVVSDHILNVLQELNGKLPEDKDKMLDVIDMFLHLEKEEQLRFILGRRVGILTQLSDLSDKSKMERVDKIRSALGVTPENVHRIAAELMTRFI